DAGISYACQNETFRCSAPTGGTCVDGPNMGTGCSQDRCYGGSNNGAVCTTATQCPGGACTGGATCVAPTCAEGPRAHKKCGGVEPACTSVADSTGWSVVFRGNYNYAENISGNIRPYLQGDGDSGCMKVCDFNL